MTVLQENLEAYIELLYEGQDDMSEKIKGTQIILQVPTESAVMRACSIICYTFFQGRIYLAAMEVRLELM